MSALARTSERDCRTRTTGENCTASESRTRTKYSYDALNRITQKSYSDGSTLTAFFAYEQTNAWGTTQTNTVGRLTEQWTGTSCCATGGAEIYGYDSMGRIVFNEQYTSVMSYRPMNYTYDFAGNMLTFTDGVGETYTQTFSAASRVSQLNSNWVDPQHPAVMASGISYNPAGAMRWIAYGNGLTETTAFNNRLQPCRYNVNSSGALLSTCTDAVPSGNLQDFAYGFNAGTANNGNVASMTATGNQVFARTYTYDALNRLSTLADSASAQPCKGLSWTYDPWANRTDQTVTSGTCNTFHQAVDTNNRLLGAPYQYDAAGNMTHDASHTYVYDAENRLIQVDGGSTATYVYDAESRRVQKTAGSAQTDYIYDLRGNVISELNSSTWLNVYLRLNGQLFAQYTLGAPRTQFIHIDHLGSTRLVTSFVPGTPPSYSVYDSMDYLPFGEQIAGNTASTHKFTGKERDSESGLDNFGARYNSSAMGRFMSPDPGNISAILNQDDPQSWNAYAYVRNNPVNLTDEDGQNYNVCDVNGKNCADLTDEQYAQFRQDNPNLRVTPSGDIYTINENGTETKTGSASYYNEHALDDLINAGNMAAPGVNLAANSLRIFGYTVAAPLMVAAECAAGAESCTKGNVAMAILPEIGALKEGALLLKEGAAVGKGAEILQKAGGATQAAKDFEALQGVEKVSGTTRIKELADGSKAVLYNSKGGSPTIAIQEGGRTVTKIRY
jgi:RHS repeat-associated protein